MLAAPAVDVDVARALLACDLVEAYQLVHDAFVDEGLLEPSPSRLRIRACELSPQMATFVAKSAGRVVGVMSVIGDSREEGLPSDPVFGRELGALRDSGRSVAEITNLAIAREFRKTSVFLELARAVLAWGLDLGFDDGFAAVSPKHGPYFERILRFSPWGERRSYRLDADDPVEGFRLDLRGFDGALREVDRALGERAALHAWFFRDNPFLGTSLATCAAAREAFFREDVPGRLRSEGEAPESGERPRSPARGTVAIPKIAEI
jgi:hypothetical protein